MKMVINYQVLYLLLFGLFFLDRGTSFRLRRSALSSTTPNPDDDDDEWDEDESTEIDDDGKVYKNPRNSPSTLCPRDEEQATLLGQKCLRKCSSDEDCKSKKKKCLCDGACGLSCIKPDRECPDPEQIAFGSVTASGKLFGARASYSCQHGYHVVGLQSRSCQGDGHWAGTSPACKQNIYCLSPPTIDHARHNALAEQTTFDLDSTLQYYCHTGYVTNGFPRAKCLAIDGQASWYGPDISCEPRSCGAPVDISHGWHAGECYTYGCRLTYHCAEGYELVGKNERFCQADGTWTPKDLPTCVLVTAVQCPNPENPRHGKAIYTSCSYNSVVSYECKYGYTLVGESTRRCGADKKWSGTQPVCKEINCGHPGRLWNGWLENIEAGTGLGASIIFRCHEGMLLQGNTSSVCQIDGKWRYPLPKCLAPCVVPHVSQGRVILNSRNETAATSTVVQHGEALTVECDPQYEFLASLSPVTCNNGTWTSIPKCEPARCKLLPKSPRNGMVLAPKTEHGMKARFKCKDGFKLKGDNFMECSFGNWTGEIPKCEEVYCPYPGSVVNGKILLVGNMGLYDYRPYVRKVTNNKQIMYDCDKGYILSEGPPGATCIGGEWSPKQLPKCLLGQHPRIRWNRKKRSVIAEKYKRAFIRNHRIIYERREKRRVHNFLEDLFMERPPKRSLSLSERIAIALNQHNNRHRRKRALKGGSGSRAFGTSHKSSSSSLNLRRGNKQRNNFDDDDNSDLGEMVDDSKLRLKAKDPCEPLSNDTFMHVTVIKQGRDPNLVHSAGAVVNVTCDSGYGLNLVENKTAKCLKGKWKPVRPMCLIDPCQLPKVQNGQYKSGYKTGQIVANGSLVDFHCHHGVSNLTTSMHLACLQGKLHPLNAVCNNGSASNRGRHHDHKTHYLGGSDIVKGGDITVIDYGTSTGQYCGPPAKVRGSLVYRNGKPIVEDDSNFPEGTEVTFNCIESIMGEKTTWKIICEEGSWIGRSLNCDADEVMSSQTLNNNSTCLFRNNELNVISFYNDQQIREDVVEFPAGTSITSRCVDIGKFMMTGPNRRRCMGGDWDGIKPVCDGLNQANDYSMEKPPTILFRHHQGPIAQSNDGRLIVYPGTVLHMECLWIRRFGNPKWTVSHDYRKYPEGWTTDPGRDSQLEYRLSIFHASKDDSGVFTCVTPARYTHSVEIEVKAVHCPVVPQRRGLTVSTQSTKMNTVIKFSCVNGNSLIGASEVTCLPSGNWSSPFPVCESIECGEVSELSEHLKVLVVSREVGGKAVFSCDGGFGLSGPSETVCQANGEWAQPFPTCKEVHCDDPTPPENGYIQGSGPYKAGDVVQFNCNPDYMMEGQPIMACQENSRWSGKLPKCLQACSYPGTTISGRMSAVKFYYKIGENITFTCEEGLILRGASILKCMKNGKWSNSIPACVEEHSDKNKEISVLK